MSFYFPLEEFVTEMRDILCASVYWLNFSSLELQNQHTQLKRERESIYLTDSESPCHDGLLVRQKHGRRQLQSKAV